jgi:hypothetical protein
LAAIFSRSIDAAIRQAGVGLGLSAALFAAGFYYYAYPDYTRVGYMPEQPIPFSHELHVGQLNMDCRYCHTNVEESPHATVPNSQTCMNCHNPEKAHVKGQSPLLAPVRESWKSGQPVEWKRIHQVPGYVYFNHSVHIARGVSCVSCHGQINEMKVVYHAKQLSMGWCLNCHYHPEEAIRPKDQVTNMTWKPEAGKTQEEIGLDLKKAHGHNPPNQCGACHR